MYTSQKDAISQSLTFNKRGIEAREAQIEVLYIPLE
jgi:hypothetical protein